MDFFEDWNTRDSILSLSAMLGHTADWKTTKDAVGRGAVERNPFLGEKPPGASIDQYFALTGGLGAAGIATLPPRLRRPLMGAYAGLSGAFAHQNNKGSKDAPKMTTEETIKGPLMMAALGALMGHAMDGESKFTVNAERGKGNAVNLLLGYKTDF